MTNVEKFNWNSAKLLEYNTINCRPSEEIGMATEEKLKSRGINMATTYEVTAKMNLKTFIDESREIAQAFTEFADNLEQIEKKYTDESEGEEE